jgi:hypothetical protein
MNCDLRNKSGCMTVADMCFDGAGRYRCTPALAPAREAGTLGISAPSGSGPEAAPPHSVPGRNA